MIDFVYNEAKKVKRYYDTNDPIDIIQHRNISLKYIFDFESLKGYYYINDGYRYIGINGKLDDTTQLIVAAHELGHDALHRKFVSDFPMHDIALYGNKLQIEREANEFAANLLLSDKLVWKEYLEGELGTEFSSVTLFPSQFLFYKFYSMKRRGYNIPDYLLSADGA